MIGPIGEDELRRVLLPPAQAITIDAPGAEAAVLVPLFTAATS